MKSKNHIAGIFFMLLIVLPFSAGFVYAVLYSFGCIGILNHGFTFDNWRAVISKIEIWNSLAFSFYIAGVSIIISTALALLFVIGQRSRNMRTPFFVFVPLTMPALVAAFFTYQFLSKSGFLSRIAYVFHLTGGLENFPDLVNDRLGIGIIITHSLLAMPFFIILFQNYYRSEKLHSLHSLSSTLGASQWQFNIKILIPLLLNKAASPLLLYFLFILGSYEIPLLLGRQDPQMISVLVNRKLGRFNLLEIPEGYIVTIIYTVLIFGLLFFITNKKTKSNVAAS